MATLLLLTNDMRSSAEILPALELLPHHVKVAQAEATALLDAPAADVILLDARQDLVGAWSLCRLIETTGKEAPLLVIAHERRAGRTVGRLGLRRPAARDRRAGRGGRTAPAGHDAVGRNQCRPGNPVRQHHDRRGRLQRQAQWCPARSHLHRVRAVEVPRTAPGTRVQPPAAAERRLGTTTTAAPELSTSMCGDCAPSSAWSTSRSSARFATSDTDSSRPPRSPRASPARAPVAAMQPPCVTRCGSETAL